MRRFFAVVLVIVLAAPVPLIAADLNLPIVPLEEDVLQRERELKLKEEAAAAKKGSGMKWLYILGGAVLLGAAAGGGGGGGDGGTPTGSVTGTW